MMAYCVLRIFKRLILYFFSLILLNGFRWLVSLVLLKILTIRVLRDLFGLWLFWLAFILPLLAIVHELFIRYWIWLIFHLLVINIISSLFRYVVCWLGIMLVILLDTLEISWRKCLFFKITEWIISVNTGLITKTRLMKHLFIIIGQGRLRPKICKFMRFHKGNFLLSFL